MERDARILRSFHGGTALNKLLCSQAPKVAKLWDSLYIMFYQYSFVTFSIL